MAVIVVRMGPATDDGVMPSAERFGTIDKASLASMLPLLVRVRMTEPFLPTWSTHLGVEAEHGCGEGRAQSHFICLAAAVTDAVEPFGSINWMMM